jgi:hypothetical protein
MSLSATDAWDEHHMVSAHGHSDINVYLAPLSPQNWKEHLEFCYFFSQFLIKSRVLSILMVTLW